MNGFSHSNANGLNGSAGNGNNASGSNGNSTTSTGAPHRSLLVIHKPSNTRLSIDGVPDTLLGLAIDLRDEFLEHLQESGKSDKLVAEAAPGPVEEDDDGNEIPSTQTNNANLFLASYWLDFIAPKHELSRPILKASRDFFANTFMNKSTRDIHDIAGTLSDTDDKKLVLKRWIQACVKIGDEDFGPTGKIWDSNSNTSVYAVLGGQGTNESYWDGTLVFVSLVLTFLC
jgi:hypothetical protein